MKQAALQALQHVRTTLAYQLTPEAVSELLEPIQRVLNGSILDHVELTVPYITAHNAKVDEALGEVAACAQAYEDGDEDRHKLWKVALHSIRSLRL
jgi:hypothetical protein